MIQINWVNTGLDDRIIKSMETQKVVKPVLIHGQTKDFYQMREVNVEQPKTVKSPKSNGNPIQKPHESKNNQVIHPAVANVHLSTTPYKMEKQHSINRLLGGKDIVFGYVDDHKTKHFAIMGMDGEVKELSPQALSAKLFKLEKQRKEMDKRWEHIGEPIDPTDLKHLDAITAEEYFDTEDSNMSFENWEMNHVDETVVDAIEHYSYQYDAEMNAYLREDIPSLPESLLNEVNALEKAIDNFVLPHNLRTYRILKTTSDDLEDMMYKFRFAMNTGGVVQELGFASTSPAWDAIKDFRKENKRIRMLIDVPKGKGRGAWIAPLSHFPGEHEFLLNCGAQFRVLDIAKSTEVDGYDVHVQLLGRTLRSGQNIINKSLKSIKSNHVDHFVGAITDLQFFNSIKDKQDWDIQHNRTTVIF